MFSKVLIIIIIISMLYYFIPFKNEVVLERSPLGNINQPNEIYNPLKDGFGMVEGVPLMSENIPKPYSDITGKVTLKG